MANTHPLVSVNEAPCLSPPRCDRLLTFGDPPGLLALVPLFLTRSCRLACYGSARRRLGPSPRPGQGRSGRGSLAPPPSRARASGASDGVPSPAGVGVSEENTDPHRPACGARSQALTPGPLTEHKRSFASCLRFLGTQPEQRRRDGQQWMVQV